MYIQANIGRNANGVNRTTNEPNAVPMSDTAWANFQQDVKEEILSALWEANMPADVVSLSDFQVHTGMGEWDGVPEESAHVSVYFDSNGTGVPFMMESIKANLDQRLSYLAFQYGQDAIAFVVTDSHLATR